jgi:hypothetical protein
MWCRRRMDGIWTCCVKYEEVFESRQKETYCIH